jgi:hypothetical protein
MSAEENSIFDEINEELKHDEVLRFLKEHQNTTLWTIVLLIAGIVGYSAWYSDKQKRLEMSTTSLYNEIYSSAMKNEAAEKKTKATLENLQKNAPSELVPLISLIKTGRELGTTEDITKTAKQLLELSEKRGVDIVWRDLAVLMYVSYKLESEDKSLERLEKLTGEDRPFRFSAMEKIAMIYENKNDHDKAIAFLEKITAAREAPKTMKERIAKVINYIKNHKDDLAENSVPEPEKKSSAKTSNKGK